jgi:glycosyltransferase involved in cell wall biosynthesis
MKSPGVSIFLPDLRGGGAERMMVNLANEFVKKGINIEIVVSNKNGTYFEEISDSVSITNLDAPEYPGFSALGAYFPLKKYLRNKNPDILLSVLTITNVVALLTYRTTDVDTKLVISQRNNLTNNVKHMGAPAKWVLPQLVEITYPWADHIITISEGVASDLQNRIRVSSEKIATIYNPVVTDSITKKASQRPEHPWFRGSKEYNIILGVGRLAEQKDFETLIQAFEKLQKNSQSRLVILGKGGQREELIQKAEDLGVQDKVDFPGFVDNPFSYMAHADVFVLSSAWEGFGNVIVEAMACGTPVVSTNCPSGPAEILQEGEYGSLVPVGNSQQLADAIYETVQNPTPEKKLLNRANQFSASKIATEYLSTMEINSRSD